MYICISNQTYFEHSRALVFNSTRYSTIQIIVLVVEFDNI